MHVEFAGDESLTSLSAFQDGCYSERADQPSEGSLSRGKEKGDPLQLFHRLPRPQRESVQVGIPLQQNWVETCSRPFAKSAVY